MTMSTVEATPVHPGAPMHNTAVSNTEAQPIREKHGLFSRNKGTTARPTANHVDAGGYEATGPYGHGFKFGTWFK
jgi:hypothetical protein